MVAENKNKADVLEKVVTKSLGVLQEQGIYAMMLFLFSRSTNDEKIVAGSIRRQFYLFLTQLPDFKKNEDLAKLDMVTQKKPEDNDEKKKEKVRQELEKGLKFYSTNIMDNYDTLFLVRNIYEQTLIYARYGAKALLKESKNVPESV